MAAPGARMRLTVEVLPLTAENAYGPYQAAALAAFKGRKFALPVQLEHTFEQVWKQIEERYKRNYLTPVQAASFTIKKLQDAYDCDLDIGDTVGDIFEGEADPTTRVIKVVPSFINRDFSVPLTSHLRPGYVHKRSREISEENGNKRRRLDEQGLQDIDPSRNVPIPSTESENSDTNNRASICVAQTDDRLRRSKSRGSMVIVGDSQTGEVEFGPGIKEESPELGLPPAQPVPTSKSTPRAFKKPLLPASKSLPASSRSKTPREPSQGIHDQQSEVDQGDTETGTLAQETVIQPETDLVEVTSHQSPVSSAEPIGTFPVPDATPRPDVYDIPSSPDFMQKTKSRITYKSSPKTPKLLQQEVDLLNHSRGESVKTQRGRREQRAAIGTLSSKARAFQVPKPDEIVSTPQETNETASLPEVQDQTEFDEDAYESYIDGVGQSILNDTIENDKVDSAKQPKPGRLKAPTKMFSVTPTNKKQNLQLAGTPGNSAKERRFRASSDAKSTTSRSSAGSQQVQDRISVIQAKLEQRRLSRDGEQMKDEHHGSSGSISNSRPGQSSPAANGAIGGITGPSPKPKDPTAKSKRPARVNGAKSSPHDVQQPTVAKNTFKRSEVPLPENMQGHDSNAHIDKQSDSKRPALKAQSLPKGKLDGGLDGSEGLKITGKTSTSKQSVVPLPNAVPPVNKTRPVIKSKVPLPANVSHLDNENTSHAVALSSQTDQHISHLSPPISAQQAVKRGRGHPPKNAVSPSVVNGGQTSSQPFAELDTPTPATVAAKKPRGRAQKTAPLSTTQVESTVLPKSTLNGDTYETASEAVSSKGKAIEEAIEISSAVSTSSSDDDSPGEDEHQGGYSMQPRTHGVQSYQKLSSAVEHFQPEIKEEVEKSAAVAHLPNSDTASEAAVNDNTSEDNDESEMDDNAKPLQSHFTMADQQEEHNREDNQTPHVIASNSKLWNAGTWSFNNLDQEQDIAKNVIEDIETQAVASLDSPSAQEGAVELETGGESARSSPAAQPKPARYLSHSPTPKDVSSESDSGDDEYSTAPSRGASAKPSNENVAEKSNSDTSDSTSDSDSEDEDVEMHDAKSDAESEAEAVPSSPPNTNLIPQSTPRVPESSQPTASRFLPRKTPVPLPQSQTPSLSQSQPPRSSQSVSQLAEARRATYRKFPGIREQLSAVRAAPTGGQQKKAFDPRTQSLGKLMKGGKGKGAAVVLGESSSDDDSSSSSSSSSEDEGPKSRSQAGKIRR